MNTKTKNKKKGGRSALKKEIPTTTNTTLLKDAEYMQVKTDDIDFSPLNYRKYISEEALQQFAEELKQHGIISALTLRQVTAGRYELVAGERRLRAARIAGLATVPAQIVMLSDEQVIEIQLSENLQREDPHPMHEAQAIGQMQRTGKTIDEIAARLGKSKQFVYTRLKLLALIDSFQEMVLADIISLQDALQIATLSETSQAEFYEEHCSKWKKQKDFRLHNLDYYLNQYRYDLKRAPFNVKDKKLSPEAGACTTCPSNSASLKTLFPEYAKQAVCSNKECYNNKCSLHFLAAFVSSIETYQPTALLVNNQLTEMAEKIIGLTPRAADLPQYNLHEVSVIVKPECPEKEDFTYENDDDEPELDEEEFNGAMDGYYSELEAYNLHVESGHYKIAVLVDNKNFEPVYFSLERPKQYQTGGQTITAKEVQAAIKTGNATPELLEAEINRIRQRENRSEQLDAEKVQLIIHKQFSEFVTEPVNNTSLTIADTIGARLVIYQSLDYYGREKVNAVLFPEKRKDDETDPLEQLYHTFSNLTEQQFSYLIRMAVCCKAESKYPFQQAGYFLYRMAAEAGLPVQAIEEEQSRKREDRKEKQEGKIRELERRIEKMKAK